MYPSDPECHIDNLGFPALFVPNFAFLLSGKNIPSLAVTNPTESIFVTSSYVNVPPIETSPANVVTPVTFKFTKGPSNWIAVTIPVDFIL